MISIGGLVNPGSHLTIDSLVNIILRHEYIQVIFIRFDPQGSIRINLPDVEGNICTTRTVNTIICRIVQFIDRIIRFCMPVLFIPVRNNSILSRISDNIMGSNGFIIICLCQTDKMSNSSLLVGIINLNISTFHLAGVIGHRIVIIADLDRMTCGHFSAITCNPNIKGFIPGDFLICCICGPMLFDTFSVLILDRIYNSIRSFFCSHPLLNSTLIGHNCYCFSSFSIFSIFTIFFSCTACMIHSNIQVYTVACRNRNIRRNYYFNLILFVVCTVKTDFCLCLLCSIGYCLLIRAERVIPEIKARYGIRSLILAIFEILRKVRIVIGLEQTNITGIDGRIIMQGASCNVFSVIIYKFEERSIIIACSQNFMRKSAGTIYRRNLTGCNVYDLVGYKFIVVKQSYTEIICSCRIKICFSRIQYCITYFRFTLFKEGYRNIMLLTVVLLLCKRSC